MRALTMNDALQRATAPHTWVYWRPVFDAQGEFVCDQAWLANSRGSVLLGADWEGLDALLARMPEAASELARITG